MPKQHTLAKLTLEPRTNTGTTSAHALRRIGKIPGVVYGHGAPTPITIEVKQLSDLLLSGHRSHIVDATIGQERDSVLLRRIEAHPITRKALSVDFQRVRRDEEVHSTVQIVTVGTPAGVREQDGVMDVILHALDIKGPADSIPDSITVDVSELGLHQHITAGQIPLPKGSVLVTNPETVVVAVETTRAIVSAGIENVEEAPTEVPEG